MPFSWGFKYKGTRQQIKVGDPVIISKNLAGQYNVPDRKAKVVELKGFITIELPDGTKLDVDCRSIKYDG